MGLQLILCLETNKKVKSDFIYINSTIKFFYDIDSAKIRITPLYMNGKGNYNSSKMRNDINRYLSMFNGASEDNRSFVIYCFDCDDYDIKQEDAVFLKNVKEFCDDKGYEFVWFCKDIEQVYLGHSIPDSMKKKESASFAAKHKINEIDIGKLRVGKYLQFRSNLCLVLDKYLTEKQ